MRSEMSSVNVACQCFCIRKDAISFLYHPTHSDAPMITVLREFVHRPSVHVNSRRLRELLVSEQGTHFRPLSMSDNPGRPDAWPEPAHTCAQPSHHHRPSTPACGRPAPEATLDPIHLCVGDSNRPAFVSCRCQRSRQVTRRQPGTDCTPRVRNWRLHSSERQEGPSSI